AVKHGFGYFFERHRLTDLLPWHEKLAPMRDGEGSERGRHLRELLDELGPTFAKFGQLLSTRPAVVPPDILAELRALHDDARVLTLELLDGVQLGDLDREQYTLEQRRQLAYLMTEAWMTMIFRHGFFHGDPHPANVLVLGPEKIGLVDFGAVGKLTDDDMSKV